MISFLFVGVFVTITVWGFAVNKTVRKAEEEEDEFTDDFKC